jgi:hypothetical protein
MGISTLLTPNSGPIWLKGKAPTSGDSKERVSYSMKSMKIFLRKTARAPGELCEAYFYSGIKRLLTGDKSGAMDLFDTCTRFEIRGFVEDQLARIQMKELTEKPDGEWGVGGVALKQRVCHEMAKQNSPGL